MHVGMTLCAKIECWDIWLSFKTKIELGGGENFMCPELWVVVNSHQTRPLTFVVNTPLNNIYTRQLFLQPFIRVTTAISTCSILLN